MSIKSCIEYSQKRILDINSGIVLANKLLAYEESFPKEASFYITDQGLIIITIKTLDALHEVRRFLHNALFSWQDKKSDIWYSGTVMIASYAEVRKAGDRHLPSRIHIWLETKPEDFPLELQSDKCRVVRLEDTKEAHWAYVCKKD